MPLDAVTPASEFRRSWRVVAAAFIGVMFGGNGFSYASFGVLVDPLSHAFGKPASAVSAWVTFLFFGSTAAAPLIGIFADKIGARRVVLITLPAFILAWALTGSIPLQLGFLYTAAFLIGCLGTGAGPLTYGRAVNTWFESGRGTALGIMSAGIGLSYFFGPRLVQAVVDAHGWRNGIRFIALAHLIALPFIIGWLRERRESKGPLDVEKVEHGLPVREVLRMPVFWVAAAAFLFYGLCAGGVTVNLVPFLTAAGWTRAKAATYMAVLGGSSVTGRVVSGWVIDRRHVAVTCGILLLIEASAFFTFGQWGTTFAIPALAATGFAFGGEVSCMGYFVARYFGVRHYGTINGLYSIVVGLGVGFGPPGFNLIHESHGSYFVPFVTASAAAIVAAILFFVLTVYPFYTPPSSEAEPIA